MGNTLLDYIANDGAYTLFGLPNSEELTGRSAALPDGSAISFGGELAVKCDDDLFLVDADGKILLVEELPDESLKALDAEKATAGISALPADFEGWETELSCASGYILTSVFKNGTLTLSPSPEPVIPNPFGATPNEPAANEAPETPAVPPLTLPVQIVETGRKRFLLRFPESGETMFFDARRFLLYAILRGRIVAGFVELPPKEA